MLNLESAGAPSLKKLLKKEFQEGLEVVQLFCQGLFKVPVEADTELDGQISTDELHVVLQSLQRQGSKQCVKYQLFLFTNTVTTY